MSDLVESQPHRRVRTAALRLFTDSRLSRLAAEGDRDAFAAIYERYHQMLYRYCRSLLRHPEDARDALQSTMLNAMRGLETREGELALKPWLFRIAHNESISLVRRRAPVEQLDDEDAGFRAGVEDDAEGRARLRQLVSDIQELPARQRGALVMRELSGLGYAEVAAALSVSIDAAKQAVFEARRALADFGAGRDMDCHEVCRIVSDGDRRVLRGRKVSAHLRACVGCHDFSLAIGARRADLAAVSPALPAATAAAVLQGIIGGGGPGGGLMAAVLGGGGVGSAVGKSLVAGAVTVVAGAGALGLGGSLGPLDPDGRQAEAEAAETERRGALKDRREVAAETPRARKARSDRAGRAKARRRERARAERRADRAARRSPTWFPRRRESTSGPSAGGGERESGGHDREEEDSDDGRELEEDRHEDGSSGSDEEDDDRDRDDDHGDDDRRESSSDSEEERDGRHGGESFEETEDGDH